MATSSATSFASTSSAASSPVRLSKSAVQDFLPQLLTYGWVSVQRGPVDRVTWGAGILALCLGGGLYEVEQQQQQDDQQLSTPPATTTPLLMTIPDDLPVPDYGMITSAIGPWWAQDEIAQMVGKPPQFEDD